jgi:hypothetical protein
MIVFVGIGDEVPSSKALFICSPQWMDTEPWVSLISTHWALAATLGAQ